ncbi:MAG: xanthine dehydrogenase family protein subunit M [Silicimonas sp.]|nr:xanthine dehydrogenase family protein subunit M [Silicimonas sp.]
MYSAPQSIDETVRLLAEGGATILAGGTDVYPSLQGGALDGPVIDISGLPDLRGISTSGGHFRIGALTCWSAILHADLPPAFRALQTAAGQVGGVQIQNAGTIAGNLCNASPAADGIPPLLILDASVELRSAEKTRVLPLSEFLLGVRQIALAKGELVTAVLIPTPPENSKSAFVKLGARKYLVISIGMAAALVRLDSRGRIAQARVAIGACSPVATRLTQLESDLVGQDPNSPVVTDRHLATLSPIDDARGTKEYRLRAAAEICRRAIILAGCANG